MDIYRASDGAHDVSPLKPADFPSLSHLRKAISNLVDIPLDNLILFLENGVALEEHAFERLWEEGGGDIKDGDEPDESVFLGGGGAGPATRRLREERNVSPTGVYAFDKLSFTAEDIDLFVRGLEESLVLCDVSGTIHEIEMSAGGIVEESGLPIHPPPMSDPEQTMIPFQENLGQVEYLRERMSNQIKALDIASGNLNWHLKLLNGDERVEANPMQLLSEEEEEDPSDDEQASRLPRPLAPSHPSKRSTAKAKDNLSNIATWPSFVKMVEVELSREASLVSVGNSADGQASEHSSSLWGMEQDMQVIKGIPIHPCFLVKRTKGKGKDVEKGEKAAAAKDEKRKMLGDYVNAGKMRTVRDSCTKMYDDHVSRFNKLQEDVTDLYGGVDEIMRSATRLSLDARDGAGDIAIVVERLLEEAQRIAMEDPDVHWQSLRSLDAAVRQQVIHMTNLKNDVTLQLHVHLRQISLRQSTISTLPKLMADLEETLKTTRTAHRTGFPHLARLRNMAMAYGQTCVEVVWRKEMAQTLLQRTGILAEAVAGFLQEETKRRGLFAKTVLELLPPFEAESLGKSEVFGVSLDLSVRAGIDDLQEWTITRDDVQQIIQNLEDLRRSGGVSQSPLAGVDDPLTDAVECIRNAQGQMDCSLAQLADHLAFKIPVVHQSGPQQANSTHLRSENNDLATRLAAALRLRNESQKTFQIEMEAEKEENDRLRLDLEHRILEDEESARAIEAQSQAADRLRADLAERTATEHILQAEIAELRSQINQTTVERDVDKAEISQLQAERSQILQGLSDARNDEEVIAARVVALQSELERTAIALDEARAGRDDILKSSVAEEGGYGQEQLAQVMQDRLDLEQKLAAVTTEKQTSEIAQRQELESARRSSEREANGLRAELSMARAQLREANRKSTNLEGSLEELAAQRTRQANVAARTLRVAATYHDCVRRLNSAIQSSATISGSIVGTIPGPSQPASFGVGAISPPVGTFNAAAGSDDDGLVEKELAELEGEDLQNFSQAVLHTMSLVKKWQRSAKNYRDKKLHQLSFSNFSKGDLALFLPTRNATAKPWAAFNISSPHNFLKVAEQDPIGEQIKTREWLVARITRIEEKVALPESNPYGLAEGIRYQVLHVEQYVPGVTPSSKRRTTDPQRPQMPRAASSMIGSSTPPHQPERNSQQPDRRVSTTGADSETPENSNNPFEGAARMASPASPTRKTTEAATPDLPFALKARGEIMGVARRPPSIASSSGSFGKHRSQVCAVGKASATSAVSTASELVGIGAPGRQSFSRPEAIPNSPTSRRESVTKPAAAEMLRKFGSSPGIA